MEDIGWFIVEETAGENEDCAQYNTGCNRVSDLYYYWSTKYFDSDLYHNKGISWLNAMGILQNSRGGVVNGNSFSEEDIVSLIQNHLFVKSGDEYRFNFACFTKEQLEAFVSLFDMDDRRLMTLLQNGL